MRTVNIGQTRSGRASTSVGAPEAGLFLLQPLRAVAAIAGDWLCVAIAFGVAIRWPNPLCYLVAAILIARTQLALAVLMHESAHGTLLPSRVANSLVGQLFAAGPLCLSLATYRASHLRHHRAPMHPRDPVVLVFGVHDYPISRRRLAVRLLADVVGIGYARSAWRLIRGDFLEAMPAVRKSAKCRLGEVTSMIVSNGTMILVLAAYGHCWLYFALWTLPSLTLLPLFGRIRAIMEHAGLPETADQRFSARSITAPSWQTFLFGPHAIHYHVEHHLYPRLPFYRLRQVHLQLRTSGQLPLSNIYNGYGAVLRAVVVDSSS